MKTIFGGLAMLLAVIAYIPYVQGILRETYRPHVFSWIIWGVTTTIVFWAQWLSGAGVGSWPAAFAGAVNFAIAGLAFAKGGHRDITTTDWVFFLLAISAIPLWLVSNHAVYAVVTLTCVDILGFGPTLRKAYDNPERESRAFFMLFFASNALILLALEHYSLATMLFPLCVGSACVLVVAILSWRRTAAA